MSRVINPDSAGKERTRLTKAVVLAVRTLARQTGPGADARDLAAFIALALETIHQTVEVTVLAWEKRDYWVKADRFRMDWAWSGSLGGKMRAAVLEDDWASIAGLAAQIAGRLAKVKVSENHRMGTPWRGAYRQLLSENQKTDAR